MERKILLVFFGIFLGLLISEIFLRLFRPQRVFSDLPNEGPNCYLADPVLYVRYKPGSVCHRQTNEFDIYAKINNLGFRGDRDIDLKHAKGKRVVFVGDSFTFGHGVNTSEAYPEVVGWILGQQGIKIETINAGMEGTELARDYLFLKTDIEKLKPEMVVVGFYLGNDLVEQSFYDWVATDEKGLPTKLKNRADYIDADGTRRQISIPGRYRVPIARESHLFIFLTEVFFGQRQPYTYLAINGTPCYLNAKCQEIDPQVEEAKKLFSAIRELVGTNHAQLLVVLIPWEMQLPTNLTRRSGVDIIISKENRHHMSDVLANMLKEEQIPYLDLLDVFESYQGEEQVFYPQDRHWTAAGHRIAGEAIAAEIAKILK